MSVKVLDRQGLYLAVEVASHTLERSLRYSEHQSLLEPLATDRKCIHKSQKCKTDSERGYSLSRCPALLGQKVKDGS